MLNMHLLTGSATSAWYSLPKSHSISIKLSGQHRMLSSSRLSSAWIRGSTFRHSSLMRTRPSRQCRLPIPTCVRFCAYEIVGVDLFATCFDRTALWSIAPRFVAIHRVGIRLVAHGSTLSVSVRGVTILRTTGVNIEILLIKAAAVLIKAGPVFFIFNSSTLITVNPGIFLWNRHYHLGTRLSRIQEPSHLVLKRPWTCPWLRIFPSSRASTKSSRDPSARSS